MEDVLLECQVCFERYDSDTRRPKILTCGHTFCLSCLCSSDNKCSNCRIPFKGSPGNLPDNFILLSAADNAAAPKKKAFWCLDCKKGADAICEENHTICSMKKILTEQIGDLLGTVQDQLTKEEEILNRLIDKVSPVKLAMSNSISSCADREVMAHSIAKDEITRIAKGVPEIENNPKEDSLEVLKSYLSKSVDRLPTLEQRLKILNLLGDCTVTVKPSGSDSEWVFELHSFKEDLSDDQKALYYLLYRIIGREHFELPADIPLPCAGNVAVAVPSSIAPSPNGTCVVQVSQNGRQLGQVTINVIDNIDTPKKDALIKGLNGVKLYPKYVGALTGSLRADVLFRSTTYCLSSKPCKGSVGICRSPLQPLSIFVQQPSSAVPKTGMYIWGKVVENIELLESIVKSWETSTNNPKSFAVLQSPRWI